MSESDKRLEQIIRRARENLIAYTESLAMRREVARIMIDNVTGEPRKVNPVKINVDKHTMQNPTFRLLEAGDEATAKPCVRLSPWHPGRCVLYRSLDGYDHLTTNRFTHSVAELDRAAHIANRAIGRAMMSTWGKDAI